MARYRRVVRRLMLFAVLVVGLAACGGSAAQKDLKIVFGKSGGTMRPYSITIARGGAVTADMEFVTGVRKSVTSAQDAELSRLVRTGFANLKSEQCAGTFPDESAPFITALGKTV